MIMPPPLTPQQLQLLLAEIAELQRIGYGEIRIEVWQDRIDVLSVTRTLKLSNMDEVQARLDELENSA